MFYVYRLQTDARVAKTSKVIFHVIPFFHQLLPFTAYSSKLKVTVLYLLLIQSIYFSPPQFATLLAVHLKSSFPNTFLSKSSLFRTLFDVHTWVKIEKHEGILNKNHILGMGPRPKPNLIMIYLPTDKIANKLSLLGSSNSSNGVLHFYLSRRLLGIEQGSIKFL